jgi:hypothetical protein
MDEIERGKKNLFRVWVWKYEGGVKVYAWGKPERRCYVATGG